MHRKLVSVLLTVALVGGFMTLSASPAFAVPPADTQNFLPDDTPEGSVRGDVLSDKFDGTDRLAHLTNVSTQDTDRVDWLVCPGDRFGPGAVVTTNAQLQGCREIGSDATGVRPPEGGTGAPPGPGPGGPADEAYEFFWNIPADLDIRLDPDGSDIVAAACIGAGRQFENDPATPADERNCTSDVENDVRLDDADQGLQGEQTSTAEIIGFCFEDNNGAAAPNPCAQGGAGAGTNAQVAARFGEQPHGANVPNDGFTIRVTSSIDVNPLLSFTSVADATVDPNGSTGDFTCVQLSETADSRTWQCTLLAVPNNAEIEIGVWDGGASGAGFCAGAVNCKLDAHYAVSVARRPVAAQLTFTDNPAGAGAGAPGAGRPTIDACLGATGGATNSVDDPEHNVLGCLVDQFGGPTDVAPENVSFEVGTGGQITRCAPGRQAGAVGALGGAPAGSRCTTTTSAPDPATNNQGGEANATITRRPEAGGQRRPGPVTVTFCYDPNSNGCADAGAGLSATVTKTFVAGVPVNISIVFAPDACTFEAAGAGTQAAKQNTVGQTDSLTVCTFDQFGNLSATTPPNAGRIEVRIQPDFGLQQATRFTGGPPTETVGVNAQATVTIEAVREGQDTIFARLLNEAGVEQDEDSARKSVFPNPNPPLPQCRDNVDNDGDGQTDFPNDRGCATADDNDERGEGPPPPTPQCRDNVDNDRDGQTDFPNDRGCATADDNDETGGGDGDGGTDRVASSIIIRYTVSRPFFTGGVSSATKRCQTDRVVEVRRVRRGPNQLVGTGATNDDGNYRIRNRGLRGRFYAKVLRSVFTTGGGRTVICQSDRSTTIRVDRP